MARGRQGSGIDRLGRATGRRGVHGLGDSREGGGGGDPGEGGTEGLLPRRRLLQEEGEDALKGERFLGVRLPGSRSVVHGPRAERRDGEGVVGHGMHRLLLEELEVGLVEVEEGVDVRPEGVGLDLGFVCGGGGRGGGSLPAIPTGSASCAAGAHSFALPLARLCLRRARRACCGGGGGDLTAGRLWLGRCARGGGDAGRLHREQAFPAQVGFDERLWPPVRCFFH